MRSHAPPVPLAWFGACMALAWGACAALLLRFAAAPGEIPVARVVAWGLALRAVGLLADPVLEDDFYRYLWDGRSFALTGTPYGVAPMAAFADPSVPPAFQAVLDGINNPDLPTIYGPVAQLVFALGYVVAPAALWPIKLALLAADGVAAALLARLGGPRALLLFATCPLAIHESAFNAHPDAIGVALALGAFAALARGRAETAGSDAALGRGRVATAGSDAALGRGSAPSGYAHASPGPGRVAAAGVCAALAVATKAVALVLVPLLLWRAGPRRGALLLGVFAATLAAAYLPFAWPLPPTASAGVADLPVLLTFGRDWEFNSTVHALVAHALGTGAARGVAVAAVALALGAVCVDDRRARAQGRSGAVPRAEWLLGALLLVAPVANPWYLLWLLPFVAVRPSRWGLTALCVVSLSYVHGLFVDGLPAYHHPVWVRPTEIGAVLVALGLDRLARRPRAQVRAPFFDEGSGPRRGVVGRRVHGGGAT